MTPEQLDSVLESIITAVRKFRDTDPYLLIESKIADDIKEVDSTMWELIDLVDDWSD
jgi:hypothetical protein